MVFFFLLCPGAFKKNKMDMGGIDASITLAISLGMVPQLGALFGDELDEATERAKRVLENGLPLLKYASVLCARRPSGDLERVTNSQVALGLLRDADSQIQQ